MRSVCVEGGRLPQPSVSNIVFFIGMVVPTKLPVSTATPALLSPASCESQAGAALFAPSPRPSQQPIGNANDFGSLLPVSPLVRMINDVVDDPALFVEFKLEETRELLIRTARS